MIPVRYQSAPDPVPYGTGLGRYLVVQFSDFTVAALWLNYTTLARTTSYYITPLFAYIRTNLIRKHPHLTFCVSTAITLPATLFIRKTADATLRTDIKKVCS